MPCTASSTLNNPSMVSCFASLCKATDSCWGYELCIFFTSFLQHCSYFYFFKKSLFHLNKHCSHILFVFTERGNSDLRTYLVFYFEDKNANNMKIIPIYALMRCDHIKKSQHSCCSQQVIYRSERWLLILCPHTSCLEITGHFLMLQERYSAVGSSFP